MGIVVFLIGFIAGAGVGLMIFALLTANHDDEVPDDTDREGCK